jgi:2-haloacid dehalogenase
MMEAVRTQKYTTVLFDLDHTLLDSDASEALAFEETLRLAGVDDPHQYLPTYIEINRALWAAVERGETRPGQVRTARFEQFVVAVGLDLDPLVLADTYVDGLGAHGELYPGAREMLETIAGPATLALVTNGLSDVQRTRLRRLHIDSYFDAIVISAEVGVSKPAPEIFDITFAMLGMPDKSTVLMVGDSLTSDIQGGNDAGIATCWYNPRERAPGESDRFDYHIQSLRSLPAIAAGEGLIV